MRPDIYIPTLEECVEYGWKRGDRLPDGRQVIPRIAGGAGPVKDHSLGAQGGLSSGVGFSLSFAVPAKELVIACGARLAGTTAQAITDSKSNAYAAAVSSNNVTGSGYGTLIASSVLTTALATTDSITYTQTAGGSGNHAVAAGSFLGASSISYAGATNGGASGNPTVSSSVAVSAGDLAIMWVLAGSAVTAPTGWGTVQSGSITGTGWGMFWLPATTTGVLSPAASNVNSNWSAAIVAFRSASRGATMMM